MRGYAGGGCEEGKDGASLMRRNKCRVPERWTGLVGVLKVFHQHVIWNFKMKTPYSVL